MPKRNPKNRYFVLKLESFQGRDTFLQCGNETQDYLFAIIVADDRGNAELIDSAYRSMNEAVRAWPEACPRDMASRGTA
jgi:hypothetical protein